MEQSMTMSMISSMTPDEFNQEEDLYGKYYFEPTVRARKLLNMKMNFRLKVCQWTWDT